MPITIEENEVPIINSELANIKKNEAVLLAEGRTMQETSSKPELRLYVSQMELYNYLLTSNGWSNDSLQGFINDNNTKSFGIINSIINTISGGDLVTAQNQLNNWDKINRVDENYAQFLNWMILRKQNISLDLNDIERLATQCPQTDGNIVFAAQNLYNSITNEHRLFHTSCDDINEGVGGRSANIVTATQIKPSNADKVIIFPNPANTYVNITGNNIRTVDLLDMYGKVIQSKHSSLYGATLSLSDLNAGVYCIRIIDGNNKITIKKLIKN